MAIKLLVIWMVIVALDFAAGFRLEYFWPVWLMLQSVADAYKYQGIVSSVVLFLFPITITIGADNSTRSESRIRLRGERGAWGRENIGGLLHSYFRYHLFVCSLPSAFYLAFA